jgi:hypothetical protein
MLVPERPSQTPYQAASTGLGEFRPGSLEVAATKGQVDDEPRRHRTPPTLQPPTLGKVQPHLADVPYQFNTRRNAYRIYLARLFVKKKMFLLDEKC